MLSLLQSGSSSSANNASRRARDGKAVDESNLYLTGSWVREDDRGAIICVDRQTIEPMCDKVGTISTPLTLHSLQFQK